MGEPTETFQNRGRLEFGSTHDRLRTPDLDSRSYRLVTGTSNPQLAVDIGKLLGKRVDTEAITHFSDGEINVRINPNLRRREVFLIQSTTSAEDIMQLFLMIRVARRASADRINAIIPYFGYARQDRKDKSRKTDAASDMAVLFNSAGATTLFTVDIHAEQTMGSIPDPWDQLNASTVLAPEVENLLGYELAVTSPDTGGAKRAQKFQSLLEGESRLAIVYKIRPEANRSEARGLLGKVAGRDVVLVDDIVDTAGSIRDAARLVKRRGAKRIIVAATHGIFSGNALKNLTDSPIEKVIVTDTRKQPDGVLEHPKIQVVTVAPLIAEAIDRIYTGRSLSALLPGGKEDDDSEWDEKPEDPNQVTLWTPNL